MHTETAKKIYASEATAKGIATKLSKHTSQPHIVRKGLTGWAVVPEAAPDTPPASPEYMLVPPKGGLKPLTPTPTTTQTTAVKKPNKPKTVAMGTIEADLHQTTAAYVGIKCGGGKLLWIGKSNIVATTNMENGKVQLTLPMAFIKKRSLEDLLVHTSEKSA